MLYDLEGLEPGTQEHSLLVEKIMATLHQHNDDEEIEDLPKLERAIGEQASRDAAASFKRTKQFVPTRSVLFFRIPCKRYPNALQKVTSFCA